MTNAQRAAALANLTPKAPATEKPKQGNYNAQRVMDQNTTAGEDKRREEERTRTSSMHPR
jgi:hypothetical protein